MVRLASGNHFDPRSGRAFTPASRLPLRLEPLPSPDWLETTLPPGYSCLISGDGTELTAATATALAGLGWPVAVLRIATVPAPQPAQLPRGLPVIAAHDPSESGLGQACAVLAATHGPIGVWLHLQPAAGTLAQQIEPAGGPEPQLVTAVSLLTKHLGPSIAAAAGAGFGAFLAVSCLDGRFGVNGFATSDAIGRNLFRLANTLHLPSAGAFCRTVDLSPELAPAMAARALLAELHDANRLVTEVGIGPEGRVTLVADRTAVSKALLDVPDASDAAEQILTGVPLPLPMRSLDGAPKTFRLWRRLTLQENPFLRDHMIGKHALLPLICMAGWLANACEGLYPGCRPFSVDDLHMLTSIAFDAGLPEAHVLDLKEVRKDGKTGEVVCDGLIWSESATGQMQYHARARITLRRRIPEVPIYGGLDLSEHEDATEAAVLYRNGALLRGHAFQSVQRVLNISQTKVTLRCKVPLAGAPAQGQFPIQTFDPYQADAQFQSMLIWARVYRNASGLPLLARRGEFFRLIEPGVPFYVSMDVRASTESLLVADIVAHDRDGRVYMQLAGAEIAIGEASAR